MRLDCNDIHVSNFSVKPAESEVCGSGNGEVTSSGGSVAGGSGNVEVTSAGSSGSESELDGSICYTALSKIKTKERRSNTSLDQWP